MDKSRVKRILVDFAETLVVALSISLFIYLTLAIPNQVDGESMEPNFHHNELLLTNKVIQWFGNTSVGKAINYEYKRGDVVVFKLGDDDLIKRIIAIGGDTLMIKDNKVFVNGSEINEKYLPTTTRTRITSGADVLLEEAETIIVPDNYFFVLGDKREVSKDSRLKEVGFISRDMIKGKVFFRYWPPGDFGLIKRGEFVEK